MTPYQLTRLSASRNRLFADVFTGSPAEWCVANLTFDESSNHGPFSTVGCEYIIEPLNDFGDTKITDETLCWGSQTRKTGTLMGGMAWTLVNDPSGVLWVMPSVGLAQKFARQRWLKMLRRSEVTASLIPKGAERHDFATLVQLIGGAAFNFVGSNSAGNLASMPCRRVVMDETDKFDYGGREEADAANLAEQRTKDQVFPQRWKTSTPTLYDGIIWQNFLSGDQRRYFVACPHCQKRVVLAWSKTYNVFPFRGDESFVFCDKVAKRADGEWDLDRVQQSAHFLCPHCQGKIRNDHKTAMVRNGKWLATNSGASSSNVSRHLPSLYSNATECHVGLLAVKFLKAKHSLQGVQGFINGDLSEPYMKQDRQTERIELVRSKIEVTTEWKKILTSDCQRRAPYFHYVIRAWNGKDSSHGIEMGMIGGGNLDSAKQELRAKIESHKIHPGHVLIDSGYGAKPGAETDFAVYLLCAENSGLVERQDKLPLCLGWMPSKGMPGHKRWKSEDSGAMLPYGLSIVDPMARTSMSGTREMILFEYSADFFKTELDKLRNKLSSFQWSVSANMDNSEYWNQLNSEHQVERGNAMVWEKLSRHRPNEFLDCEVMQLAKASFHGYINIGQEEE